MPRILLLKNGAPQVNFTLGDKTVIGRSSECEIQIFDPGLSKQHALIFIQEDAHWIEDLKSKNGTFLNGIRIDSPARLKKDDEIILGGKIFIFNPALDILHERLGDKSICIVAEDPASDFTPNLQHLNGSPEIIDHESYLAIHRLTCEMLTDLDLDLLLNKLMDRLLAYFSADRGYIFTYNSDSRRFRPLMVRTEKQVAAISRTLVEKAITEKKPLIIHDALEDVSFNRGKSIIEHQLRSVMLVPLMIDQDVIGFIQLDRKEKGAFNLKSLSKLTLVSKVASRAIHNAHRFECEKRKNISLQELEMGEHAFVGEAPNVLKLLNTVRKAAQADAKVIITGESGTGKELIARMIHDMSPRAEQPWIAVNCAAIAENLLESELFGHEKGAFTGAAKLRKGCFELADGGTLFLDEIAEISPAIQVKLLRAVQENSFFRIGGERPVEVDVRIVAATNRDLKKRIEKGLFREDLYYRLNVISLEVPPLRERKQDISLLTRFFISRFGRHLGKQPTQINPGALALLTNYSWPGNVRELQNVVERIMVLAEGNEIVEKDLPMEIRMPEAGRGNLPGERRLNDVLAAMEKEMLISALMKTKGKKVDAARVLGISRPTLDKKIADYQIEL